MDSQLKPAKEMDAIRLQDGTPDDPERSVAAKLAAIREAAKFCGPTGDIDQMNREIEQGYLSDEV